jgi:CheY-like chemotaxis protein
MPRMNGIELIRTLRGIGRFKDLPIIVVSYRTAPKTGKRPLRPVPTAM